MSKLDDVLNNFHTELMTLIETGEVTQRLAGEALLGFSIAHAMVFLGHVNTIMCIAAINDHAMQRSNLSTPQTEQSSDCEPGIPDPSGGRIH